MNLIFLQNCISPHQMPYIKELPVYGSVDRVVVVAPRIDYDYRKQMGWKTPEKKQNVSIPLHSSYSFCTTSIVGVIKNSIPSTLSNSGVA